MSRPPRKWNHELFYHVGMRGNNRTAIFEHERDKHVFLHCLNMAHEKFNFEIVAYCIMINHYHLLIRSTEVSLSKVMAFINLSYSRYFSKTYAYDGQLYDRRFYANEIKTPFALLAVSAYIHRNPIDTKFPLVKDINDYSFCSYRLYTTENPVAPAWLNLNLLPTLLPEKLTKTRQTYSIYCLIFTDSYEENLSIRQLLEKNGWM